MEMNENERRDPVERLVSDYLESEAVGVDGAALLGRVRRTRRAATRRRYAAVLTAAAAVIAIVVAAVLLGRAQEPPPLTADRIVRTFHDQGRHALGGVGTISLVAGGSLHSAAERIAVSVPAEQDLPDLSAAVARARKSLHADAEHVKGKLKALFSHSIEKAGLVM